jgi:mRNA interferase RelE/StbE
VSYAVELEGSAERDLKRLPREVLRAVDAKLLALAREPRPPGCRKLVGREGAAWRVRVGSYRILYTVDDAARVVRVYRIRPRPTAYR